MEIKKVGSRGTLITFYDLGIATNIYVIHGKKYTYMIDTYLGPDIIKPVKDLIKGAHDKTPVIIINTHSHWDHVWGNSLFSGSIIISHKKCREYMQSEGLKELKENAKYQKGEVILTYPNLTLTDKLCFEEDHLLIWHTPGHTDDSISILDMADGVLFAGDNLERPIPYLMSKELVRYIDTLQDYLKIDAGILIGGHTACEDKKLAEDNLDYVRRVLSGESIVMESKEFEEYHRVNLEYLNQKA
ncbi:MAG TPA: Zn-dependent hydrolase [Ruminiclostridium sp.]|nr:Zn-dependent hydrolase [Ruminiclostridium sp.]